MRVQLLTVGQLWTSRLPAYEQKTRRRILEIGESDPDDPGAWIAFLEEPSGRTVTEHSLGFRCWMHAQDAVLIESPETLIKIPPRMSADMDTRTE